MDIRDRVDEFLAAPKAIIGPATWEVGTRPEVRIMKRSLLQDGEALDAFLHCTAYPTTPNQEFRHLIVFAGKCVTRLDYAPTVDGTHFNGFSCPPDYPPSAVSGLHYHDWEGNRHLARAGTHKGDSHHCSDVIQALQW